MLRAFTGEAYEKAKVVARVVEQAINTVYLTRQRLSVRAVHDRVKEMIGDENKYRDVSDRLPVPHVSAVHKVIRKLDPYMVACARMGKQYADEKFRVNQQGPRPTRALERVECDHTRLDLMVVDPRTRLPLGRPWLTTIIDVYTKMILGFYLAFHHPGAVSVIQCLRHAIRPKSYLAGEFPSVENDWPAHGVPECLVVDNGREFHGEHLADACLQLDVCVQYSPPRRPWYRPSIERWFGTQNRKLLHELPGTTFSNIFEKDDYDPKKHAVISLDALNELIHIWIVDIYHQEIHGGIEDIPQRRWKESVAEWPPNLPRRATDLDVLVGFVEQRVISSSGIEMFSLRYNCAGLAAVRRALAGKEKATVKYDPNDISVIYVWDKIGRSFLPVPALDQDYAKGLTLWQHEAIRRYARKFIGEQVDAEALCRARRRIEEIVRRERLATRRAFATAKPTRAVISNGAEPPALDGSRDGAGTVALAAAAGVGGEFIRLLPAPQNAGVSDIGESFLSGEACEADAQSDEISVEVGEEDAPECGPDWSASYELPRGEDEP